MDDYDIVTTSQHNPAGGDSLVFMRGHLTLVRNRPETEAKIMGYEFFVNYSEWEMMGRPTAAVGGFLLVPLHCGRYESAPYAG
jgi:hypothetical protein